MGSTKHFQSLFCEIRETDLPAQIIFLDHGFLKGLFSVPYWGCKQSKYIFWLCVFVIVYILERDRLFSFNCEFFLTLIEKIFLSANDHLNLGNIPYVISRIYFIGCYNTTQFNTSLFWVVRNIGTLWDGLVKKTVPKIKYLYTFVCISMFFSSWELLIFYNVIIILYLKPQMIV